MKDKEPIIRITFWALWALLVSVCVYYIIHNAWWLIGDDAIVIRHTGFGKAFLPSDTVSPSIGRFYPFSYLVYNVLLLFGEGRISPMAHYALHAAFFVLFAVSVTVLTLRMLQEQKAIWKYTISYLTLVIFIGRTYPQFTECFSTSWCGYTVIVAFLSFTYLFYENKKWVYGIMALLCINYLCYCGESLFVLPLSMGVCALLFQRKTLIAKEKVFNWLLVGSALLFLTFYAVSVLPYIHVAYDGAHGSEVSMVKNALQMLWGQKLLVLAFVLFIVRMIDIIKNKKEYNFFDNLLVTAAACCVGNFILRLNWTLYYNNSALLAIPSILYFSIYYLKEKYTVVLFLALALLFGRKILVTIQKNQMNRKTTYTETINLLTMTEKADGMFWYAPETENGSFNFLRDCVYWYLCTYLGWIHDDEEYSIQIKKEFDQTANTVWLTSSEYEKLFPLDTKLSTSGELVFEKHGVVGYRIETNSSTHQP